VPAQPREQRAKGSPPYMLKTRKEYGILFIVSLFCECIHPEYVRFHGIYRVNQAEYGIRILVAASQEYVNTYSTRRVATREG